MATHDYSLANQSGASFRTDLNNALAAIQSNNSNSSSPTTTVAYQWWADTTANIFKIRNSGNNAWINLFTLAGGIDVDAASNFGNTVTFAGDVTFDGATAGRDIVFDQSANALTFADSAVASFGASGDFRIFHNGSDSILQDQGTGSLIVLSNLFHIKNAANNEDLAKFTEDAGCELFFNNVKKIETVSGGVDISGDLIIDGAAGGTLTLGGSSAHTSKLVIADNSGSSNGNLLVEGGDGGDFFTINSSGNVKFEDSKKALFGAGADLELFHDGSNSHIAETGTGSLLIKSDTVNLGANSGEFYFRGFEDGACFLRFDNSNKFFTHSLGVTVESTGNTPTIVFRGASSLDMGNIAVDQFSSNNSLMTFSTLSSGTQGEVLRLLDNKQILLGKTTNASTTQSGIIITSNGNCQYSQTGTGDHDFLEFNRGTDGSMNRIGLIRTSGSGTIYNTTSDYRLKENAVAISDGITRLKTLKPYRFNFKIEPDKTVDGFFAHEVTAVPEAITGTKDEVDSDNKPVYQGIDHSRLIPLLVAAVQELITKVETLEAA